MASKSFTTVPVLRDSGAFSPVMIASVAGPLIIIGAAVSYAPLTTLSITAGVGAIIAFTVCSPSSSVELFMDRDEDYVPGAAADVIADEYNARPWDDPMVYDADIEIV